MKKALVFVVVLLFPLAVLAKGPASVGKPQKSQNLKQALHENNLLANAELAEGKYDEALEHAKTAADQVILARDASEKAAIYNTIAMAYVGKKQYDLGLPYIEYAISKNNPAPLGRGDELKTYGNVLSGLERGAEACKAWSDAVISYYKAENERKQDEMQKKIDEYCRG